MSLLFVCLSLAFFTGEPAMPEMPDIAEGVVLHTNLFYAGMREGVACYRIPALVTTPNGVLLAAIDERVPSCQDLDKNPNINIVLRHSKDHGVTWSDLRTLVDYPEGISASDPSMIPDPHTGTIFLFYNYMDHRNAPGIYRLHVMASRDDGLSWTIPEDITAQITRPEWHADFQFITSGRGSQTRAGLLLHTLVNLDKGLHIFGSRDHGKSWFLAETPLLPGDESKVLELADGRWMVNSRVKGAQCRYVHLSDDEGKTWTTRSEPALPDPACNACLLRYSSAATGGDRNRLLFCNANSPRYRRNLTVRVSYDEGATWPEEKVLYPGLAAYASMTVLDNGDIGLLFEKDDYRENVFVRFTLEWLTDGRDRLASPPPDKCPDVPGFDVH